MNSRYIDEKLRKRILDRDGYRCRYCGSKLAPFHIDHVYPFSKGGESTFDNLVVSCQICNLRKHNTVGMWPKPIGYFDDKDVKKKHSPMITLITLFGVIVMINGVLILRDGVNSLGSILFIVGMAISFFSISANLTRPQ